MSLNLRRGALNAVPVLLLLSAWIVQAAPPPAAATAEGARIASSGTPNGAAACAGCHGARGEGMGTFPHLAGTGANYLREQLDAFASGQRKNPTMQPIAQALSPEQRAQVAAYYAGLASTVRAADSEAANPSQLGPWLATRGRWTDELPACAQCHGPGGMGVGANFPPLAGQPAAYIEQQLKAWKAGERPAGPLGLMQAVARKLSDADVKAVSDYYAGLAKAAPDVTATGAKGANR